VVRLGQLRCIAHHEFHRLEPLAGQMAAGGGDLLRVEIDVAEPRFGMGLADLTEYRAHVATAPGQLSTPVIRPTLLNRVRPVELLQQQQAGQLVGEGERREAEAPAGAGFHRLI